MRRRRRVKANLWDREPARLLGILSAFIALLSAFGFRLTGEQVGTIMAFSGLLLAELCRQHVSPVGNVEPLLTKDDLKP